MELSTPFPVSSACLRRLDLAWSDVARPHLDLLMIDSSDPSERKAPEAPSTAEARLRQQAIGAKLRQMFDEVVNEPVPDDFLAILKRADENAGRGDR